MEAQRVPPSAVKPVVVDCDMVTAYGRGVDICWQGLMSGRTALSKVERFDTRSFRSDNAALVHALNPAERESLVVQMLFPLLRHAADIVPEDTLVILATTAGEIDLLEKSVLGENGDPADSRPDRLLAKVCGICGVNRPGLMVSAACVSSTAALAHAASLVSSGVYDSVLVAACDSVTEFVYAGFSSLMALDENMARPFDMNRGGLSLGEGAAFALIMSRARAEREQREAVGAIAGWGLTSDANHMTGPSRDGTALAAAIHKALQSANIRSEKAGSICAHGTGTVYNDAMEMKAFRQVFGTQAVPIYSIKGGTGHTLGAAGLVEVLIAFKSMSEQVVPPTVNLECVDADAAGWALPEPVETENVTVTISTNSGFGGVNAALALTSNYSPRMARM